MALELEPGGVWVEQEEKWFQAVKVGIGAQVVAGRSIDYNTPSPTTTQQDLLLTKSIPGTEWLCGLRPVRFP